MPRRIAMSTLVTRGKQRADMENASFISDASWKALFSEKYGELYGVVCDTGYRYFETTSTITATGATSYNEPTDVRDDLAIDHVASDGTRRRLTPLRLHETNVYAGQTGDAYAFAHVDDQIYLYPNPSSGTYQFIYVAQAPDLSAYADADLVDVCHEAGEAFLIWGVAAIAKGMAEQSVIVEAAQEEKARLRLEYWAARQSVGDGRRAPALDYDDGGELFDPAGWRRFVP